jgi:hypothetical protein
MDQRRMPSGRSIKLVTVISFDECAVREDVRVCVDGMVNEGADKGGTGVVTVRRPSHCPRLPRYRLDLRGVAAVNMAEADKAKVGEQVPARFSAAEVQDIRVRGQSTGDGSTRATAVVEHQKDRALPRRSQVVQWPLGQGLP